MSFIRDLKRRPGLTKLNAFLLGLLFLVITVLLWPSWRQNPDLSHGLFMPALFLLLIHESRHSEQRRYLPGHPAKTTLGILSLISGLLAIAAAGLFSASVGWNHALVTFSLTAGTTAIFFAGLLVLSDREVRLVPFNWTALVAIGLWILCAPIPPGTYSRLTLTLQLMVSQHVLSTLQLLGVAASRHGNIIELANTSVGVAEACSGVRSLISCIFAGFFFSATLVRRPWARAVIIFLAAPIALGMNFIRSVSLTLLANRGVDISGAWHDVTGFAVLGVTALILGALAILLDQGNRPSRVDLNDDASFRPGAILPVSLNTGLVLIASLGIFFYLSTRSSDLTEKASPNLLQVLPAVTQDWQVQTSTNLFQFSGVLETENLAERTYRKRRNGEEVQVTVYLAFWEAGKSSVSQVAMHTPDACWPGSGWEAQPVATPRDMLPLPGHILPLAESRVFHNRGYQQYVWFWHIYDGRPIAYVNPLSPAELLRNAWRYGFIRQADQIFVRVSSNLPWDQLKDEPLISDIFSKLKPLGF